jgi:hypothetical protein
MFSLVRFILLITFYSFLASCESEVDLSYWLRRCERKVYSQNGEDGLIEALIDVIEATVQEAIPRTFVEFGVQDGMECNTRYLRETRQFSGVLLDGSNENPSIHLHKHFITAENINQVLGSVGVPLGSNLGILSIDLDRNDWYVWRSILEENTHRAVIVIIEYNSSISPDQALVVPYSPSAHWDGTHFYGASLRALVLIGKRHGYALVACDSSGTNAFFIDTRWQPFSKMQRGGFGSLLLPSIHSAYVRANYIGEQPPSSLEEHDRRLSLPVVVENSLLTLECGLIAGESFNDQISSCSQEFVRQNGIRSSGNCSRRADGNCAIESLIQSLIARRWLKVSEDGEVGE